VSVQAARRGTIAAARRRTPPIVLTPQLSGVMWTPDLPPTSPSYGQAYHVQSASTGSTDYALGTHLSYGRFEVRSGDCWQQDIDFGNGYTGWGIHERSEVGGFIVAPDTHVWMSYSIRITPGSAPTDMPPELLYQGSPFCIEAAWHSTDSPDPNLGANPLPLVSSLQSNGLLAIQTRSYLQPNPNGDLLTQYTMNIMDGTWHRIVHHIIFYRTTGTLSGTGLLQSWLDGTSVFNTDGIRMGSAQINGPYWKFGIYRSHSTGTAVIAYANMEVATGATALQSRIATPLTMPTGFKGAIGGVKTYG